MDALALILSVALPWGAGCALLLAVRWPTAPASMDRAPGQIALVLGYGWFLGILLLTLWMRLLSVIGIGFGRVAIAAPLLVLGALALYLARGRIPFARVPAIARSILQPPLAGWERIAWLALLAWLALRLGTLAVEVGLRPLYPWDAWAQWAAKARVWYELGRIAPFVPADAWLAGATGFVDASPGSPATIPLFQAWSAIALGRWDDSALGWPWLVMLAALGLALYGMLRDARLPPLAALAGAGLAVSLPLLDAHAALAGYPDVILAGTYTLAALALHRWASRRDRRDAALALCLGLACPAIAFSGAAWMLTLLAGAVVAFAPRRGSRIVAWALAGAVLALVALTLGTPMLPGFKLRAASPWRSMADAYFLFDNWHLLWYAVIALAIAGGRKLVQPPLAPLATIAAVAVACLVAAAIFGEDIGRWLPEARAVNRATLHVAPLLVFLGALLWREWLQPRAAPATAPATIAIPRA